MDVPGKHLQFNITETKSMIQATLRSSATFTTLPCPASPFSSSSFLSLLHLRLLLLRLLLRHSSNIIQRESSSHIESNENPNEPKVHPPLAEARIDLGQEVVRSVTRAVEALLAGFCLGQITIIACEVRRHVLAARHARRRVEPEELVVGAVDGGSGKSGGEQAFGDVLERVDTVHEDPEPGEFFWGCDHTRENSVSGCSSSSM
jgi:hypothetical protein